MKRRERAKRSERPVKANGDVATLSDSELKQVTGGYEGAGADGNNPLFTGS